MEQATELQDAAELQVDVELVRALQSEVRQHEADYELAVRLDKIRQERSVLIDGKFSRTLTNGDTRSACW